MALLVVVPDRNNDKLMAKLAQLLPNEQVVLWHDKFTAADYDGGFDFVLAWNPPADIWHQLPHLKAISSYGAGVDALLKQPNLPELPIARIVDPQLAISMGDYVLHAIGYFKLRFSQYLANKSSQVWRPRRANRCNKVGILGLGELGQAVATRLLANGFEVSGWSRQLKTLTNVHTYSGKLGLSSMLAQLDYLVCLLPLTTDTRGILNQSLFAQLPQGAVIINVARGQHLNEVDLLAALDSGQLSGAALDVFITEPLPPQHDFWRRREILLTPHISAVTSIDTATSQIAENYLRLKAGKTLLNQINRSVGY